MSEPGSWLIKALGGKRKTYVSSFCLNPPSSVCFGAFFGIVLGVFGRQSFSMVLHTGFVVPWAWVITGIIICTAVGLLAGLLAGDKGFA